MNKIEFLKALERQLSDLPEQERKEALKYYEEYLDDAGIENEIKAIKELGDPEDIAAQIRAGLSGSEAGAFTEKGYEDVIRKKDFPVKEKSAPGNDTIRRTGDGILKIIGIICSAVFLGPVLLSAAAGVFGIVVSLAAAAAVLWFGFFAAGLALFAAGIALLIYGAVHIMTLPYTGASLIGCGFLLFGFGLLLLIFTIWMAFCLLPPFFRGIVSLCSRPFRRGGQKPGLGIPEGRAQTGREGCA